MKKIIWAVALSALTLPAYADTTVNGKISTLGLGLEAAFPMTQSIDARIGFNTYKYNFNKTTADVNPTNFSGNLNLQSLQALADWHPWEGSFRVSGGLVYNNNKFTMTGQPTGATINVGGTNYPMPAGASVNATVDFSKVVPYFGFGWGRTPKNTGLSFTSDIGIIVQGTPKSSITTVNIPDTGTLAADVAKANADLNDSLKNFKMYPVLSLGIGYTF